MVAVERIVQFSNIQSEGKLTLKSDEELPCDWPKDGRIEFTNVSAKYRIDLPPSLTDINFIFKAGERVGVVGRTGSGKSTLLQVLFRLLDETTGEIKIDGIDIAKVGLHTLRKKIAVIPQTPILFDVSLRDNLDPFGTYSDEQILTALDTVQMTDFISTLPGVLNHHLTEGGQNFSVGQRQLICLARAVLLKSKILVLDEPTANVDSQTDERLQAAVSIAFKGSTIISIAHRINTIIDYDKILVLGNGKVLEFGNPTTLLNDQGSVLSHIVRETGEESEKLLKHKAFSTKNEEEEEEEDKEEVPKVDKGC
jgi:ABC-type multidrug transport system fused ATPase/permease subunit